MAKRTPSVRTRDGRVLTASKAHPARYSEHHFPVFIRLLAAEVHRRPGTRLRVLDPMGGLGGIHHLGPSFETVANEIEPVFVEMAHQLHPNGATVCGDATALAFPDEAFDAVVVSPAFGSRMRDAHQNKDACKTCSGVGHRDTGEPCGTCWGYGVSLRRSYTHDARRLAGDPGYTLASGSSGTMSAKSAAYWELHERAWAEALRVLRPGGLMLLDVKDYVEGGKVIPVVAGHRRILESLGYQAEADVAVTVNGLRNGENSQLRVAHHTVIVARKPAATTEMAA